MALFSTLPASLNYFISHLLYFIECSPNVGAVQLTTPYLLSSELYLSFIMRLSFSISIAVVLLQCPFTKAGVVERDGNVTLPAPIIATPSQHW